MPSCLAPFVIACTLLGAGAWVLPGTAPMQYEEGAPVELKVNKLTSPKTHLGFEHYSLAFCRVRS
jgi:transmembrane 9 superfamily protein 2/4